MDPITLLMKYEKASKPHTVFLQDTQDEPAKLAEVAKAFLRQRAMAIIKSAGNHAVLVAYSSDGTPQLVRKSMRHELPGDRKLKRKFKRGAELLVERVFVKAVGDDGQARCVAILSDPRPMDLGKTAWHHWAARKDFMELPRALGHFGILVNHYCFDRAVCDAAARKIRGYHNMWYASVAGGEVNADLLQDLEWTEVTGCANHDCQNALKWGLKGNSDEADKEVLKKIWIVVESLKNGFGDLHSHLAPWLATVLSISPITVDRQPLYRQWAALGVHSETADFLADAGVRWIGGKLHVSSGAVGRPDFQSKLTGAMLEIFRFRTFTHSRWTTIGKACRTLVGSLLLGVQSLVAYTRAAGKNYYLKGIRFLDDEVARYVAVAGVVANVADAPLLELLTDDRLALRVDEIEEKMLDEMKWIAEMPIEFWTTLGDLSRSTGLAMRSQCISSSNTISAYIHHKCLYKAKQLPWSLCRGEIKDKLFFFGLQDEPTTSVTAAKIWRLVQQGIDTDIIVEGIQRLGEVRWSTTTTEQAHGSAAIVHRFHPDFEMNSLCQRSLLHSLRSLWPCLPARSQDVKIVSQIDKLSRQQPHRIQGRMVFLAEALAGIEGGTPLGRQAMGAELMRTHSARFKLLPEVERAEYEQKAVDMAKKKLDALEDKINELHIKLKGLSQDSLMDASLMRLAGCQLTMEDIEAMACMWDSGEYSRNNVQQLRIAAMKPPAAPDGKALRKEIESHDEPDVIGSGALCAAWKLLVKHRGMFKTAAIRVTAPDGSVQWLNFVYAVQQPALVCFQELTELPNPRLFPVAVPGIRRVCAPRAPAFRFSHEQGKFAWGKDIVIGDGHKLDVLTCMRNEGEAVTVSFGRLIEWDDFTFGLDQPGPEPAIAPDEDDEESEGTDAEAGSETEGQSMADMIFENPWLADRWAESERLDDGMSEGKDVGSAGGKKGGIVLDEARIAAVWEAVIAKRREFAAEELAPQEYFKTSILGGAWTEQHKGVPFDSVMCFASGRQVVAWCTKYHVQKSKRFGFRGHGEAEAHALALYTAQVLSYYYAFFVEGGRVSRPYTEEELDRRPNASAWLRDKAMHNGRVCESLFAIHDIRPYV